MYQVIIQKFLSEHVILMMFLFPALIMIIALLFLHWREMLVFKKFFPYKYKLFNNNLNDSDESFCGEINLHIISKNFLTDEHLESIIGYSGGRLALFELYKDYIVISYSGLAVKIFKGSENYEICERGLYLYSLNKNMRMQISVSKKYFNKIVKILEGEYNE